MHAGNDAVGCQDQIASGRRREHGRVIDQTQRAGMGRERTQIACDQTFLGGFRWLWHRAAHRQIVLLM